MFEIQELPRLDGLTEPKAAKLMADWLVDHLPNKVARLLPACLVERLGATAGADGIPARDDLTRILQWWNRLAAERLVPHSVRVEKPAKEILLAWKVFLKDKLAQESLSDLDRVEDEIRHSELVRGGWFRLEKLLRAANNGDKTPIVKKLIEGGYRTHETKNSARDAAEQFLRDGARTRRV